MANEKKHNRSYLDDYLPDMLQLLSKGVSLAMIVKTLSIKSGKRIPYNTAYNYLVRAGHNPKPSMPI